MGLETITYKILAREVQDAKKNKKEGEKVKVLCLGYPDLVVHENALGVDTKDLPKAADEVGAWHGWKGPVYDTKAVFDKLGVEPTFIDIKEIRGGERVADLNEPLPEDLTGIFDIVLDAGTLEHCFNIGQGFKNVVAACSPSALIIHVNPISQINHGFWNISPTAYRDFYSANGFGLLAPMILFGPLDNRRAQGVHFTNRIQVPPEATNVIVAKRVAQVEFKWPTQFKYQAKG